MCDLLMLSSKQNNSGYMTMAQANQFFNRQTSQQKNSIAIFCDIQNVCSIKDKDTARFLLEYAKSKGRINYKKLYYNSQYPSQVIAKNNLEFLGIECVDVPDSSANSADNRLMADCVKLFAPKRSPIPDIIILVLGDWDYAGLISILQAMGKKVIVFAQRGSASPKLNKLVGDDNFHFVDELPQLVANKTPPQTTTLESRINYNEAIDYLIEAIKIALSQGKFTEFGYIDNLMRQNCVQYKGFTSIQTPNGQKFKSFSKFVDAAVKDGKVQIQNQQLFLIELDKIAA